MAPDIQEECSATPKPEEEVPKFFSADAIFCALLFSYCEIRFRVQSPIGGGDG